jgi:predicted AAA+ superfamily ATPase
MKYSGFPEPFLSQNKKILNLWRQGRLEKVGSPLSKASLREDLEVSFDTVKRWLKYLEKIYYCYTIRPFSKSIMRSLKKNQSSISMIGQKLKILPFASRI